MAENLPTLGDDRNHNAALGSAGRFTLDADTANAEVGVWLRDVANMRVHAETKERPIDRFAREQPFLLPRAPRWRAEGQAAPADLTGIAIQQHDLSIYDAIGDAIGRAVA